LRSAAEAKAAGYAAAHPPPGTLLIDSFYVAPPDEELVSECRQAAGHLGMPVPCPGLLPTSPGAIACNISDPAPCVFGRLFYFEDTGFSVPPGYVGTGTALRPSGHLLIIGARTGTRWAAVTQCHRGGKEIGRARVRGHPATLIECPESAGGDHSGHVLVRWIEESMSFVVSLHGLTEVNRRLATAVAIHIDVVTPVG
jgi:hypothetical protein